MCNSSVISSPNNCLLYLRFARTLFTLSLLLILSCPKSCAESTPDPQNIKQILSLSAAFDEGLTNSPRTAAARLQLGITKSQLIRATELPNPTIFMDNGYKAEFTYRYGILIPIEPPWKLILRIARAKNQIKQTNFEITKALWNYRANIRRAYTELIVAQELYRTYAELADLTENLHHVAQKKFEAGEVAELDVYRAEQESAKAEANKEQQRFIMLEAEQSLAILLGRSLPTAMSVPLLPPDGPSPKESGILPTQESLPPLDKCLALANKNRPDLLVVRQALRTNRSNLHNAIANIIPNTSLGVGSSVVNGPSLASDARIEDVGTNIFHGFFVQVFQELPILNFQQGDLSEYKATGRQLNTEIKAVENIVAQEVTTSYQRLGGAQKKIEIYQKRLLDRTIEIVRLARLGYEVGQSDLNDVLLAQRAAIEVKTEYLKAVADYQIAFKDLEQSVGTPLQ